MMWGSDERPWRRQEATTMMILEYHCQPTLLIAILKALLLMWDVTCISILQNCLVLNLMQLFLKEKNNNLWSLSSSSYYGIHPSLSTLLSMFIISISELLIFMFVVVFLASCCRWLLSIDLLLLLSFDLFLLHSKFMADCFVAAAPPLSQCSCNIRYICCYCCYL